MTAAAGDIPERPSRVDSKTFKEILQVHPENQANCEKCRGQNAMLNVEKGRFKAKQIGNTAGAKPLKSARSTFGQMSKE